MFTLKPTRLATAATAKRVYNVERGFVAGWATRLTGRSGRRFLLSGQRATRIARLCEATARFSLFAGNNSDPSRNGVGSDLSRCTSAVLKILEAFRGVVESAELLQRP